MRRSSVNRAPAAPSQVLRHMRRHSQMTTLGHEISRVETLVSAHRHRFSTRNPLQHYQRRIAFCRSLGHEHLCVHDQSIAILHQRAPAVTQLGLLPLTLARHLSVGIGLELLRIRPLCL